VERVREAPLLRKVQFSLIQLDLRNMEGPYADWKSRTGKRPLASHGIFPLYLKEGGLGKKKEEKFEKGQ